MEQKEPCRQDRVNSISRLQYFLDRIEINSISCSQYADIFALGFNSSDLDNKKDGDHDSMKMWRK